LSFSEKLIGEDLSRYLNNFELMGLRKSLKNVTYVHQSTVHGTTSCPTTWRSYGDDIDYCDVTSTYL